MRRPRVPSGLFVWRRSTTRRSGMTRRCRTQSFSPQRGTRSTAATRRDVLGHPSHGCIRIAPANAAKLFALVSAEGLSNTKVVVTVGQVGRVRGVRHLKRDRLASDRNRITARRLSAGPIPYPATPATVWSAPNQSSVRFFVAFDARVGDRHLWTAGPRKAPRRTASMPPPRSLWRFVRRTRASTSSRSGQSRRHGRLAGVTLPPAHATSTNSGSSSMARGARPSSPPR